MELGIGPALKSLRKEKNLSLREASRRAGVSHPYLSQLENGKNDKPSLAIMERLAKTYDITLDDLMSRAYVKTIFTGFMSQEEINKLKEEDNELKKKKDIMHLLKNKNDNTYYNGKLLSSEDRQRVLNVLENLLPEYHKD